VESQVVHTSIIWNLTTQKPYSRVIPDLLIQRRGSESRRLAIDAKYKLYDQRRIDPSDIYQTFLYAYALSSPAGRTQQASEGVPTALLIYPSSISTNKEVLLEVRPLRSSPGARVLAVGVPIPQALEELGNVTRGPVLERLESLVAELMPAG